LDLRQGQVALDSGTALPGPHSSVFYMIGYVVFLWWFLNLLGVSLATPDIFVTAITFIAAGLLLRIHVGLASLITFDLVGVAE
jgi:hypothetical protein